MSICKYHKDKSRQRSQEGRKKGKAEPTQSYPYPTSAPSWSHPSHKNSSNYLCLVTDPAHSNKVTLHLNFTDVRTSWPLLAFKSFTLFVSPYQSLHFAAGYSGVELLMTLLVSHFRRSRSPTFDLQRQRSTLVWVWSMCAWMWSWTTWVDEQGKKKCSTRAQIICWVTRSEIMIFCGVASTTMVNVNNSIHQHLTSTGTGANAGLHFASNKFFGEYQD